MAKSPLPKRKQCVTQKQFRNKRSNVIPFPKPLTIQEKVRLIRMSPDGGYDAK